MYYIMTGPLLVGTQFSFLMFGSSDHVEARRGIFCIQELDIGVDVWQQCNARDGLNRVRQVFALSGVFDIRVDEQRVCFGVDVFHHDLEPVETTRLGDLNLVGEMFNKILVDDTIGSSEEGQYMGDEMTFVVAKLLSMK